MAAKIEFFPKLKYYEVEYLLEGSFGEKTLENTSLYNIIKKMISKAHPSQEDKFDKRWFYFYLPVKRRGKLVSIPFSVMEYRKEFFVGFHKLRNLHIKKGKVKIEEEFNTIFKEALRFIPVIKKSKSFFERTVPYDIRTGKIKGKYILNKLMNKKEKKKIILEYKKNIKRQSILSEISLNEYLRTAAICYKAAYKNKTKKLSNLEMYKKWADGRDGGMLSIKNKDNKKEFSNWMKYGKDIGSHPFEIVFSLHRHGIHFYPPNEDSHFYSLRVTNYGYAWDFIKMLHALIKNKISFKALDLENVLDYLSGETYFAVNEYSEHFFDYVPSKDYKKKYFKKIEWDKIELPMWIT